MFIILVYASVTFKTKCDIRSVHEHLKKKPKNKNNCIWQHLKVFTIYPDY